MQLLFSVFRSRCRSIKIRPYRPISSTTSCPSLPKEPTTQNTPRPSPRLPATDEAIAVDDTATKTSKLAAQCVQPRAIFPWRSSPYPLERLTRPAKPSFKSNGTEEDEIEKRTLEDQYYDSDYFLKGGPLGPGWISPMEPWFRAVLYTNSMNLLGVSWPSIIMPWTRKYWEQDMAWNFCHAFSSGVKGMIEDTYILAGDETNETDEKKSEEDSSEAFDVNLEVTLDPIPLTDKNGDGASSSEGSNYGKIPSDIYEDKEEFCMLERNLRQLYQSARQHSHPSKVNIVLRTEPQSATIESMFPVLGLSRNLVESHPNIRHTYRNFMERLRHKNKEAMLAGKSRLNPIETGSFIIEGFQEIMERSAKLNGDGNASITVVAQVSIHCKEVFCVKDVESGDIIQGYGDGQPRDVTHLVRFEMVVRERLDEGDSEDHLEDGDWEIEMGRWQITDWDDLLDGNVFFT